jgi:hypothetical protein
MNGLIGRKDHRVASLQKKISREQKCNPQLDRCSGHMKEAEQASIHEPIACVCISA